MINGEIQRRNPRLMCCFMLWVMGIFAVTTAMTHYNATPGRSAYAASDWPVNTGLHPASDKATLLVFIHPHCPCTSATLAELERLAADAVAPVQMLLIFGVPESAPPDWQAGRNWQHAERLPGAERIIDRNGRLAKRFGATTSGHCMMYLPDGKLRFQGGITLARGHEGSSYGGNAIRCVLAGNPSVKSMTPVFGCDLVVAAEQSNAHVGSVHGRLP